MDTKLNKGISIFSFAKSDRLILAELINALQNFKMTDTNGPSTSQSANRQTL